MVFLSPTKQGLRSPILKCKILLARNHMALLHNQPLLCTSISAHHFAGQSAHHCFSSLLLITASHHYCSSINAHLICSSLPVILLCSLILLVKLVNMLITAAQHCCSSLLLKYLCTSTFLITAGHYFLLINIAIQAGQSAHVYIIAYLIIHNY